MRTYIVTINGKTPLLLHNDDVEWADAMEAWGKDPKNKAKSKAGDDRTPPFRWLGSLYIGDGAVAMPSDNIMASVMGGGAMVLTGGKNGKTFKSQTQSGCVSLEPFWPLLVDGKAIPTAKLFEKKEQRDFDEYQELVAKHGFSLYVKRARVGPRKHIRVRPRFDNWSLTGTLAVTDDQIKEDILVQILQSAGMYKGLGDWRPGGRTPGPYGMFEAEVVLA